MSEPTDTLSYIAYMADNAIQGEIKRRLEAASGDRGERLLLYLSCIKQAAYRALPDHEKAVLPFEPSVAAQHEASVVIDRSGAVSPAGNRRKCSLPH
ncbi:hypothetical protein [Bradyrhizobium sp. USDA 313]|uniref:hypothetical protein n=1 Tax=Bradyrhizobium sp. USDA 313 TaxID=3156307 RepID=UPI0035145A88